MIILPIDDGINLREREKEIANFIANFQVNAPNPNIRENNNNNNINNNNSNSGNLNNTNDNGNNNISNNNFNNSNNENIENNINVNNNMHSNPSNNNINNNISSNNFNSNNLANLINNEIESSIEFKNITLSNKTKLKEIRNILFNINSLQFGSETFDLLYNIITTLKPISKKKREGLQEGEMSEFKSKREFILSFDGCSEDKRLNELRNMLLSWNKKGLSLLCNLFELKDQNSKSFNTRSNLNVMVEMILSFLSAPQEISSPQEERKKPKINHPSNTPSSTDNKIVTPIKINNTIEQNSNSQEEFDNWVQCGKCGKVINIF